MKKTGNVELLEDSTSSEETFLRAEQWLDKCVTKHTHCNGKKLSPQWFPTRLLYLESEDKSDGALRLIETIDDKPTGPYVTLSHCWGGASFLQLTQHNIDIFRQGVALQHLPKTFTDAIAVARRLKISYIWIDSLCILQDQEDRTDWHRESSQMDKVYSQAYCNISAAVATNSTQGLFFSRDPRSLRDSTTTFEHKEYYEKEMSEITYAVVDEDIWNSIGSSHVNTRGWVLQERLLAPRVLHFGRHELHFECREMQCSESHPDSSQTRKWYHADNFKAFDVEHEEEERKPPTSELEKDLAKYSTWGTLVEKYSTTALTNRSDKLPALSGIAKVMKEKLQDDYVVGMWRKYLHSQLLWCMAFDNDTQRRAFGKRPPEYRAPSWSWTSIEGPVMFHTGHENNEVPDGIVDVHLQYTSEDTTGAVLGGYIDISGTLRRARLVPNSTKQPVKGTVQWSLMVNGIDLAKGIEISPDDNSADDNGLWEVLPDVGFPEDPAQNEKELYFMPLWVEYPRVCHALLMRLEDEAEGVYSRVGIVIATGRRHVGVLCGEKDDDADAAKLPCRRYEDGVYTIRII